MRGRRTYGLDMLVVCEDYRECGVSGMDSSEGKKTVTSFTGRQGWVISSSCRSNFVGGLCQV